MDFRRQTTDLFLKCEFCINMVTSDGLPGGGCRLGAVRSVLAYIRRRHALLRIQNRGGLRDDLHCEPLRLGLAGRTRRLPGTAICY